MGKSKKAMMEQEDDWTKQDVQPQEQQEQEEEDVFLETLKAAARAQSLWMRRERSKLVDAMYDIWVLASLNEKKHEMDGDDLRGILRTICAVCQVVSEDVLAESAEDIEEVKADED